MPGEEPEECHAAEGAYLNDGPFHKDSRGLTFNSSSGDGMTQVFNSSVTCGLMSTMSRNQVTGLYQDADSSTSFDDHC